MKFLWYTQYYWPEIGAPPVRLEAVVHELTAAGHAVEVVTALPNYPAGKIFPAYRRTCFMRERHQGVDIYRAWLWPAQSSGMVRLLAYLSFQAASFVLVLWRCIWFRPQYLVVESPPLFLGLTALFLRLIFRVRYIFNVADKWPACAAQLGFIHEMGIAFKLASWLERLIYRFADFVSLVQPGHTAAVRQDGVPAEKIVYLPNGAYLPEEINEISDSEIPVELHRLCEKKNVILYAGNHGKAHGLQVILQAAKYLEYNQDILFILIGNGSEKANLQAMAESMKLENVVFHDSVSSTVINRLYQCASMTLAVMNHADLAVRSAKIFPMMASGTPLLYVGGDDAARILEQYRAGLVVREHDGRQVAAAIERLLDDPDMAPSLIQASRACIAADFNWKAIVTQWGDSIHKDN